MARKMETNPIQWIGRKSLNCQVDSVDCGTLPHMNPQIPSRSGSRNSGVSRNLRQYVPKDSMEPVSSSMRSPLPQEQMGRGASAQAIVVVWGIPVNLPEIALDLAPPFLCFVLEHLPFFSVANKAGLVHSCWFLQCCGHVCCWLSAGIASVCSWFRACLAPSCWLIFRC